MDPDLLSLSRVIHALSDPALLLDVELRALAHNLAFAEAAGMRGRVFERALAGGSDPFSFLGSPADHQSARSALARGQLLRLAEVEVQNSQGATFTVYQTFSPILGAAGKPIALLVIFRNVSDEARIHAHYKVLLARETERAKSLEAAVDARTRELSAALEEVTRLSRTDPLTGLYNRRSFTEFATQALRLAERGGRTLGVILCDLDHFKRVNDTYGHQAGDAVLVASSRALVEAVRSTDRVARFGGEEFIILLTETADEAVDAVAERCRERVRQQPLGLLIPGASQPQTVSIGTARFPRDGSGLDELLQAADQALYHAKRLGRDRVVSFDRSVVPPVPPPSRPALSRPLVLVVDRDRAAAASALQTLQASCEVEFASPDDDVVEHCQRGSHDVLVFAEELGAHRGLDLLRKTMPDRPDAVRIVLLEDSEVFARLRSTSVGRVDWFLVRSDVTDHLGPAVADGMVRRELRRETLLRSGRQRLSEFDRRLGELEEILEHRQVHFAYQPIVDARSHACRAYEALCRVDHELFSNPAVLFDASVLSGNVLRLGRIVRERAMLPLGRLLPSQSLFVNLHPTELDDPEFLLSETGGAGSSQVVFEITERASIPDFERVRRVLNTLRGRGYRFAIDDLGAGYASLNSIAHLGAEFIKIDMALVRGVDQSERKSNLIRSMVEFAHRDGIEVIAEGVETAEEAAAVTALGCDMLQGYYFGRPLPFPADPAARPGSPPGGPKPFSRP